MPSDFGILDIDVYGLDYWLWEALTEQWRPRIVVCECNSEFAEQEIVVEAPGHEFEGLTETWGCSISALEALANSKGYTLVYRELAGVNAFFVRSDLIDEVPVVLNRSPKYGLRGIPHPEELLFPNGKTTNRPTVCP